MNALRLNKVKSNYYGNSNDSSNDIITFPRAIISMCLPQAGLYLYSVVLV